MKGSVTWGTGSVYPWGSVLEEELTIRIYNLREAGFTDTLDEKWLMTSFVLLEQIMV